MNDEMNEMTENEAMKNACRKMTNQSLKTDQVNWRLLLTHPSELVRIDEKLRMKQLELRDFDERTPGYNVTAAQTHLEHQRLIFSMRCYCAIVGMNFFHVPILSIPEFHSLKNSFVDRENFTTDSNNYVELSSFEDEFWLILQTTSDKNNSEKFFKKIMSEFLVFYPFLEDKEKIMDTIIKHCRFMIHSCGLH
jgi:hypothetical protein